MLQALERVLGSSKNGQPAFPDIAEPHIQLFRDIAFDGEFVHGSHTLMTGQGSMCSRYAVIRRERLSKDIGPVGG